MGDEQKAAANGHQILEQCDQKIGDGRSPAQQTPVVKTGDGAGDGAQCSQNRAQHRRCPGGIAQGGRAHRAEEDADAEWTGLRSGWDEGQLVGDQFAHGKEGENHQGNRAGEEGKPATEMEPSQMSSQATTAGAVIERSPQMQPIKKA